ncbi:MAG: hypothetical protein E7474_02995 [Ruminococcaceae bacterium]|nr:hypothetical protein [Oscillospiraceae bacterium]
MKKRLSEIMLWVALLIVGSTIVSRCSDIEESRWANKNMILSVNLGSSTTCSLSVATYRAGLETVSDHAVAQLRINHLPSDEGNNSSPYDLSITFELCRE